MEIARVEVGKWGEGSVTVILDGVTAIIKLTEQDIQQFMYLADRIYEQHQQGLVEEFRRPLAALADFSEVEDS